MPSKTPKHQSTSERSTQTLQSACEPSDIPFMRRALALAHKANTTPGTSPIGCIVVHNGVIIGEGFNEVGLRHNPTAHAEMVAIERAGQYLLADGVKDAVLYSTLQPCGMCTMATIWSRISRIVYGAGRADVHDMYFEDRHLETGDFLKDAFKDNVALVGGVLRVECAALYYGPNDNPPEAEQANID